ncbi:hypothetical protein ABDK00_002500 [Niabella insulamsoli]|uniref:hypothetical protein n=1 Tax=Niabella insulamsoli TaxID=3144874 RepID=UPI0031FE1F03
MKILIEIPDDKAPALMEVLNDISYVKTSVPPSEKKKKKQKESRLLRELRQAVEEVKLIEAGKKKGRPARELLDEL